MAFTDPRGADQNKPVEPQPRQPFLNRCVQCRGDLIGKILHTGRRLLALKKPNGPPLDPLFVGVTHQVVEVQAVDFRHTTDLDLDALRLLTSGLQEICQALLDITQFG